MLLCKPHPPIEKNAFPHLTPFGWVQDKREKSPRGRPRRAPGANKTRRMRFFIAHTGGKCPEIVRNAAKCAQNGHIQTQNNSRKMCSKWAHRGWRMHFYVNVSCAWYQNPACPLWSDNDSSA